MTTLEKAKIAEDRAYKKYGGYKHLYYNGTVPDLVRYHNGVCELIEVKYFDLGTYSNILDRVCGIRKEIEHRKECFRRYPHETKQRLYILFVNARKRGATAKELKNEVYRTLGDLNIKIDIDVCEDMLESEDKNE